MKLSKDQPVNLIIYKSLDATSVKFTTTVWSFFPASNNYYTLEVLGSYPTLLCFKIEKEQMDNSQESIWLLNDTDTSRFVLLSRTDDFSEAKRELARAYVRRMQYNKAYDWIPCLVDSTLNTYIKRELDEKNINDIYSDEREDVPNQKDWIRECKRYILEHMDSALEMNNDNWTELDDSFSVDIFNNTPLRLSIVSSYTIKGRIHKKVFDSIHLDMRKTSIFSEEMSMGQLFNIINGPEVKAVDPHSHEEFLKLHPEMKMVDADDVCNFSFTHYRSFEIDRFSRIRIVENHPFTFEEKQILKHSFGHSFGHKPVEIQIERIKTSDEKRALYQKRDLPDDGSIRHVDCLYTPMSYKVLEKGPERKPVRMGIIRLNR